MMTNGLPYLTVSVYYLAINSFCFITECIEMTYNNTPRRLNAFDSKTSLCKIPFVQNTDWTRNISIPNKHDISTDGLVWLGRQSAWIDLRGCIYIYKRPFPQRRPINTSFPLEDCFNFCLPHSFGLTSEECVCMTNRSFPHPEKEPFILTKTIIGKTPSIMCMYGTSEIKLHSTSQKDTGDCLFAFVSNETILFGSDDCSKTKKTFCITVDKSNSTLSLSNDDMLDIKGAIEYCRRKGRMIPSYPLLSNGVNRISKEMIPNTKYWIGTFLIHAPDGSESLENCLAANVYRNGTVGLATRKNCSTPLPSLCLVLYEDTTSSRSSEIISTSYGFKYTTEIISTTSGRKNENNTILLVSLVAGAILFVTIIIFLIVFCLRYRNKGKYANKQSRKALHDNEDDHKHIRRSDIVVLRQDEDESKLKIFTGKTTENNDSREEKSGAQHASDSNYHDFQGKPTSVMSNSYDHVTFPSNKQENDYDVFSRKGRDLRTNIMESDYDTTSAIRNQIMEGTYGSTTDSHKNKSYGNPDVSDYDTVHSAPLAPGCEENRHIDIVTGEN